MMCCGQRPKSINGYRQGATLTAQRLREPVKVAILALLLWLAAILPVSAATIASQPLPAGTVRGTVPQHGFVYYTFSYPAQPDKAVLTIQFPEATTPFDQAVGFNIYWRNGTRLTPEIPTPQERIVQFPSGPSGTPVLLQIYNYAAVDFDYVITQSGILPPPAPLPPVSATSIPLRMSALNPYTALPLPQSTTCSLLPGDTLYYVFRISQSGQYTLSFSTQPGNRSAAPFFGIRILDTMGKQIARSTVQGVSYSSQQAVASLTPGLWYIEVYNVSPDQVMMCTLTASGSGIEPGATL